MRPTSKNISVDMLNKSYRFFDVRIAVPLVNLNSKSQRRQLRRRRWRWFKGVFTWENSHRCESHTGMTFWFRIGLHYDRVISYLVIWRCTCDSKSQTLRMRYPFQCFRPKRVVVSRLHDTAARFRTGVKFSPRYKNRGELTPGCHVNKCRAMRGNRSEFALGRKSPRCHVNTP